MATSLTSFRNHGLWCKDDPLQFWLGLLIEESKSVVPTQAWLTEMTSHWFEHSLIPIGGAVNPNLEEYVQTDATRDVLLAMSLRARDRIKAFRSFEKEFVGLDDFGIFYPAPRHSFGCRLAYAICLADTFIQLLKEEIELVMPEAVIVYAP